MSRSTASLPHPRPKTPTQTQTNSLPTRNPPHLSPATRDRHLKKILDTHRSDRHKIQARHDEATGDLTDKLRRALSEVRRIEREFQSFQSGASAKLADVLAENERLRARVAHLDSQRHSSVLRETDKENRSPLRPTHGNINRDVSQRDVPRHGDRKTARIGAMQTMKRAEKQMGEECPRREAIKPSERELEVERLREAARDSRRLRVPRRPSLRVLRKDDLGGSGSLQTDGHGRGERRDQEERRSVRLVRSLSRKWSTCF